jgi:hypothetical protein
LAAAKLLIFAFLYLWRNTFFLKKKGEFDVGMLSAQKTGKHIEGIEGS